MFNIFNDTLLLLLTKASATTTINDWGALAISLAAIGGVCWALIRYFIIQPLDRRITAATRQIQPDANGGKSLTDANKKIDKIEIQINSLDDRLGQVENRIEDIYKYILIVSQESKSKPAGSKNVGKKKGGSVDV